MSKKKKKNKNRVKSQTEVTAEEASTNEIQTGLKEPGVFWARYKVWIITLLAAFTVLAGSTTYNKPVQTPNTPAITATDTKAEVVPVTWEVTPEHPMIDTDEARALYKRIKAEDYPSLEELKANPVVAQLDALSAYYKELYGNTAEIDTPERNELRQNLKKQFLAMGSARTESISESGKHNYVYDGPLKKEYQMILVLGLPASGKSTRYADPRSEEIGAFILDVDMIKAELPEYKESHAAAADAIHFEGFQIFEEAVKEFLSGDLKGTNAILPIVGTDLDELMESYIKPFEEAGYNVKVEFCPAKENEAAARVVMRELGGGQLINSAVAFNFGDGPENVYNELKDMINSKGEPYGMAETAAEEKK